MAKIDLAKSFWKTVRSVSVRGIEAEARKPFALAIVGDSERRAEVLGALFPSAREEDVLPGRSLIRSFDTTSQADGFPQESGSFDLVIDAGGGRATGSQVARVYSVEDLGGWHTLVERLIEEHPDLSLALGRRFPGLRDAVADRVVRETALANAEFAMLSALPGVIPVIGPLLPAGAIGDIFMLTKNQVMLMYRLAALYERPLDVSARARDLAPILAQAFGWRALAREIMGAVPGGVGLMARGSIAYAGTMAVGRALHALYRTGRRPTRAQIGAFYREAAASARDAIRGLQKRLPRKPRQIPG